MKLKAYAIRDVVSDTFHAPFFAPSDGVAKRVVSEILRNPGSELSKYPRDYMVFRVGEYDTETGALAPEVVEMVVTVEAVRLAMRQLDPNQHRLPLVDADGSAEGAHRVPPPAGRAEKFPKVVSDPGGIFEGTEQEVKSDAR